MIISSRAIDLIVVYSVRLSFHGELFLGYFYIFIVEFTGLFPRFHKYLKYV